MKKYKSLLNQLTKSQIITLIILSIILLLAISVFLCYGYGDYFFWLLLSAALLVIMFAYLMICENKKETESLDASENKDALIAGTTLDQEKLAPSESPAVENHQIDDKQNPGHQTVVVVQQPQAVEKQVKGRVWGTLGMLYMAGYALYINYVIDSANVTNLGEAIGKAAAYSIFQPFFYCVLASALLSFVGVVGKNKTCILLALTATIGAFFILPGALEMLLIPAVIFLISFVRMDK